jgi:SP family general alpha glucoside:H+ symporter-like MFS transporter
MQSAVAYASDIAPVALRGYLTIFVSMCWIIGQFIAGGLLVGIADAPGNTAFKVGVTHSIEYVLTH